MAMVAIIAIKGGNGPSLMATVAINDGIDVNPIAINDGNLCVGGWVGGWAQRVVAIMAINDGNSIAINDGNGSPSRAGWGDGR